MAEYNPSDLLQSAWKIIPHFKCSDIQKSITFYKDKLGFLCEPDDDPPNMVSVAVGKKCEANIYIFSRTDKATPPSAAMIALGTKELDQYYEYISQRGDIEITMEIENQPWGYRQFEIKDPDGNLLQFFKFLEGGNPGTE